MGTTFSDRIRKKSSLSAFISILFFKTHITTYHRQLNESLADNIIALLKLPGLPAVSATFTADLHRFVPELLHSCRQLVEATLSCLRWFVCWCIICIDVTFIPSDFGCCVAGKSFTLSLLWQLLWSITMATRCWFWQKRADFLPTKLFLPSIIRSGKENEVD